MSKMSGANNGGGTSNPSSSNNGQNQQQQQQNNPPRVIASSSDACASIVNSMMHYRQGGEPEAFSRSAITSLVKKLKEKRDELDALILAVTTNGTQHTGCVTIPKTLDGRLQVAARKGFPHVIYAKIWRWPDLHKNELKQADFCQYGFDHKDKDLVCVNPYHYNRVIGPGLDLSGLNLGNLAAAAAANAAATGGGPPPSQWSALTNVTEAAYQQQQQQAAAAAAAAAAARGMNQTAWNNGRQQQQHYAAFMAAAAASTNGRNGQQQQQAAVAAAAAAAAASNNGNSWYARPSTVNHPARNNGNTISSSNSQQQQQQQPAAADVKPKIETTTSSSNNGVHPPTTTATAATAAATVVAPQPPPNRSLAPPPSLMHQQQLGLISKQPPPEHWASVAYFELDTQVGETFKVNQSTRSVVIDGYMDPVNSGNHGGSRVARFCLGALTNVHRTEASEKTRPHIGRGIELQLVNEGDVWVKCLSEYAVFVRSYYLDREAGRAPGDNTVHKIHPEAYTKVFDLQQCFETMQYQCAKSAAQAQALGGLTPAAAAAAAAAAGGGAGGVSVDDMRRLCILRLSFVKGFGPDYINRPTIKDTPCWIEVHLYRALQVCDEVLHTLPNATRGANNRIPPQPANAPLPNNE